MGVDPAGFLFIDPVGCRDKLTIVMLLVLLALSSPIMVPNAVHRLGRALLLFLPKLARMASSPVVVPGVVRRLSRVLALVSAEVGLDSLLGHEVK